MDSPGIHHSKIPLYKALHSSDLLILNYFSVIIVLSFNFSKYIMAKHQQQRKAKDVNAHSYAIYLYPIFFNSFESSSQIMFHCSFSPAQTDDAADSALADSDLASRA